MPALSRLLPDPIQWHEGMLLVPQHFQQYDLRQQQALSFHLNHISSFYWGVESQEFDEALLTSGKCRLLSFCGVLPDGTLIDTLPGSTPYLEVDLVALKAELQKGPLNVYLCLPELKGDSSDILGQLPRYRSIPGDNVMDVNTGDSPVMIPRLEYKLELIVAKAPPARYVAMPIQRIQYDGKTYAFDVYQEPILHARPSTKIWVLSDQISSGIRSKLGYIQQKMQSIGQNPNLASTLHELDTVRTQMLSSFLMFEALQQINGAHPFPLYCSLCGVAGTVSGVSRDRIPPRFSPYNHNDPLASFTEVTNFIQLVLNQIQESYSILSFAKDDRTFSIQLQEEWESHQIVIGVQTAPGMGDEDLIKWINNAVFATTSHVEHVRESRILGASRRIVDSVAALDLIPAQGMKLVMVDADPNFIDFKDTLQVFNVSDNALMRPLELILYRPQKAD